MDFELTAVGVDDENETSFNFNLEQNYPNPFNPSTLIKYTLPSRQAGIPVETRRGVSQQNSLPAYGVVTLKVYDILGNEIATLVNKKQAPGNYSVKFNASNLPTGIYFYKLKNGGFSQSKKMILLK